MLGSFVCFGHKNWIKVLALTVEFHASVEVLHPRRGAPYVNLRCYFQLVFDIFCIK